MSTHRLTDVVKNMRLQSLLLNIGVGFLALLLGWSWVAAYQIFLGNTAKPTASQQPGKVEFDINDPNSVLPIDYEDDKLSDPKDDETNEAMFDPEGVYAIQGNLSEELAEFEGFEIVNKNLEVDCDDKKFGESVPARGYASVKDPVAAAADAIKNAAKLALQEMRENAASPSASHEENNADAEIENNNYTEFEKLSIAVDGVSFSTISAEGISYKFAGKFLKKGNFYTLDPDATVIEGTLSKYQKGKRVAEEKARFTWNPDIECHC